MASGLNALRSFKAAQCLNTSTPGIARTCDGDRKIPFSVGLYAALVLPILLGAQHTSGRSEGESHTVE